MYKNYRVWLKYYIPEVENVGEFYKYLETDSAGLAYHLFYLLIDKYGAENVMLLSPNDSDVLL